jgi:secreted trypsin-like serine protease
VGDVEEFNIVVTIHDGYEVRVEEFRDYFELAEFMAGEIAGAIMVDVLGELPSLDASYVEAVSIRELKDGLFYEVITDENGWAVRRLFRADRAVQYKKLIEVDSVDSDETLYVEVIAVHANRAVYYSARLSEQQINVLRRELKSLTTQGLVSGGVT